MTDTRKPWLLRRYRIGRVQVGIIVWRHEYALTSDRWVIQPSFVYDRKGRTA